MRKPFFILAFLTLILGCSGDGDAGGNPPGEAAAGQKSARYDIAVIPKGTTHEFWKSIHAGARKAEKEINGGGDVHINVIWKGPFKEDETRDQIDLVNTFIGRGVDGIVLAPLDKNALVRPVRSSLKAKIPVVIMDSGLEAEAGKDFIAYVATDNYQGGVLGARRLAEVLGGKGNAILLRYQVGSESTMQREKGFLETISKEFSDINIISSDQYAGATEELSYQKSQNLLTRFRDEVDGIFCPNESSASGMLGALKQAGLAGKVKFVGFDASEKLVNAVREGHIHGLVLQNPVKMGYLGVKTLVQHLRNEKVELVTDTGAVVVTPENMDAEAMKELHSPDLSRWLEE